MENIWKICLDLPTKPSEFWPRDTVPLPAPGAARSWSPSHPPSHQPSGAASRQRCGPEVNLSWTRSAYYLIMWCYDKIIFNNIMQSYLIWFLTIKPWGYWSNYVNLNLNSAPFGQRHPSSWSVPRATLRESWHMANENPWPSLVWWRGYLSWSHSWWYSPSIPFNDGFINL